AGEGKKPCVNLECRQLRCSDPNVTTTVTGTVYDPRGRTPLYNAIVYVPNAPLAALVRGATCERCGTLASGSPIATTLTAADGTFVLSNVPVGDDVPLVIQIGKWRRKVVLPRVEPCVENAVKGSDLLRLPRTRAEGDIPQIAVATGALD